MNTLLELNLENLQEKFNWATIKEVDGKYNCYNYFGREIFIGLDSLQDVDYHLMNYIQGKFDIEKI